MPIDSANGAMKSPGQGSFARPRSESQLLLSTTYSLNTSDTKRLQVGLRTTGQTVVFKPTISLLGNTANGIHFDSDTWTDFKARMADMSSYLSAATRDVPAPILLKSGVAINFTTAYGVRAIMVTRREEQTQGDNATTTSMAKSNEDRQAPSAKRQKLYSPNIVMQRVSFEGLASVVRCIDARYEQLHTFADRANECCKYLLAEIELNLPRDNVDEDAVRNTLTSKYDEIEGNVRRQVKDLQFLDYAFNIVFSELTSIYLYEIAQHILRNVSA